MRMLTNLRIPSAGLRFSVVLATILLLISTGLWAQSTVSTGSIVGTVTDPSGAVVNGAKVTVTNTATGQTIELVSNSAGAFNSGSLSPGNYKVQVAARGFNTVSTVTNVQVGNTSSINAKMTLGQESTTIEVQASSIQVNTEQATVQGVLTSSQIENLPVNGRNFLDLAQLEPGVQIQDGQNFDPTKAGYSSISFGGRFGRTARINVDGVDVSDETVGTTTADIPASAIDEFQLSQSSLDLSQDLTSSGAVNVTTKSGTNAYQASGPSRTVRRVCCSAARSRRIQGHSHSRSARTTCWAAWTTTWETERRSSTGSRTSRTSCLQTLVLAFRSTATWTRPATTWRELTSTLEVSRTAFDSRTSSSRTRSWTQLSAAACLLLPRT